MLQYCSILISDMCVYIPFKNLQASTYNLQHCDLIISIVVEVDNFKSIWTRSLGDKSFYFVLLHRCTNLILTIPIGKIYILHYTVFIYINVFIIHNNYLM